MERSPPAPTPAFAEVVQLSEARARQEAARRAPRRGSQGGGGSAGPTLPTPRVTYGLMAAIGLAYAVQLHFDTFSDPAMLIALGSGYAPLAQWSEPWRLLSPAFLHGSPMHLLTNLYVLYAIGGFLERQIGGARLAILFVLSVLGGSILSGQVNPDGHSVGASGGLFGMLAVQGALGWRGYGLIPEHALPGVRKAAAINLGINIVISTMPQIDAMAHLGGALVGAALSLSGLLFRGVPRSTAPPLGPLGQRALPIVAGLCLTLLGGSLATAWYTGGAFVQ